MVWTQMNLLQYTTLTYYVFSKSPAYWRGLVGSLKKTGFHPAYIENQDEEDRYGCVLPATQINKR